MKNFESTKAVENAPGTHHHHHHQELNTHNEGGIITQVIEANLLTTPEDVRIDYDLPLPLENMQSEINDNETETHNGTNNSLPSRRSLRKTFKRKIEDVMEEESTWDSFTSSYNSLESDPLNQTTTTTTTHNESLINNEDSENSHIKSDPLSPLVPMEEIYLKSEGEELEGVKVEFMEEQFTERPHFDFMVSRKSKKYSRPRRKMNSFSREEEESLVEWYKGHVFLYDKEKRDHKNPNKKRQVLEEKGRSMNPPVSGDQISTWIDTNRTRFGKLTTPKAGMSRPIVSARDRWIVEKFSFLSGHIRRHSHQVSPGEQSFSLFTSPSLELMQLEQREINNTETSSNYQQQVTRECEQIPDDDDDDDDDVDDNDNDDDGDSLLNTSVHTKPSTTTTINDTTTKPTTTATTTGEMKQTTEDNEFIEKIMSQLSDVDVLTSLLKKLEKKSPRERTVDTFYEYMTNMTMDMNPQLWREYTMKVMQLGNHYMKETEKHAVKKLCRKKL